jgi:hypothetical protein
MDIHDDLLIAQHAEQINMLHVTIGRQRKSTKLDAPDADTSLFFRDYCTQIFLTLERSVKYKLLSASKAIPCGKTRNAFKAGPL